MNATVICGATATGWSEQPLTCTKTKGHKVEEHWDTEHRVGWSDGEAHVAERQLIEMIDNACFHGKGGLSVGWTTRLVELVEQRVRAEQPG